MIPDEVKKCVVFLGCRTEKGMKYGGTGFFVGLSPQEIPETTFLYCVTAKHNIEEIKRKSIDEKVYIRANLKEGNFRELSTPINQWLFHPQDENIDVAVLDNALPYETFDFNVIPSSMAITNEIIEQEGIGIGREEGIGIGREEERKEMAKRFIEKGIDLNIIAEATGLSREEVDALALAH